MKKLQLYLLLGIVIFATGCPKYRPPINFSDENTLQGKFNQHLNNEQKRYYCYRDGKDYTDGNPPACSGTVADGPAKAQAVRNELIDTALSYIDKAYGDFKNDLTAGRDRTNFVADLIELGTSAAVGITNGERPLQILGIALTAFRGGRRSADVNFYKDQSTPILISKMNGTRAKVRATILDRQRDGIDKFTIGQAISEIVEYYNAGTLVSAFEELNKDTAVQTKQAEDNLQVLKGVPITPEATQAARDLSVGASDILADLKADLESADAARIATATKRLQNIMAALEKNKDVAVALKAAGASSSDTDGVKLRADLITVRRSADDAQNTALLDAINQAIVDTPQ
jgi:hypothetical protein